jgi:Na+/H+ antiporter NhaA
VIALGHRLQHFFLRAVSFAGHRIQSLAFGFVRWDPSSALLLGLATVLALLLSNLAVGPAFQSWLETRVGIQWGASTLNLTLHDWVNHGLLTIFFFLTLSVKDDQVSVLRAACATTTEQWAFMATASDTLPQQESLETSAPV